MSKGQDLANWWDEHPFFRKFYCPLVLTATFIVSVTDAVKGTVCK